jgi:hypothetical protein
MKAFYELLQARHKTKLQAARKTWHAENLDTHF